MLLTSSTSIKMSSPRGYTLAAALPRHPAARDWRERQK
jgi:hypothetical protein